MKINVNFQVPSKTAPKTAFKLVTFVEDTVGDVKKRIVEVKDVPFPEQDLMLAGKVLAEDSKLSDYGIKDGACLDFVVKASDETIAQQLAKLLQSRSISLAELKLMYTHKHGMTLSDAFATIGLTDTLEDFLGAHKRFTLSGDSVAVKDQSISLKITVKPPTSSAWVDDNENEEAPLVVEIEAGMQEKVATVIARAEASGHSSGAFPELQLMCTNRVLDPEAIMSTSGVPNGASLVLMAKASVSSLTDQLTALFKTRSTVPLDYLSMTYKGKYGVSADHVVASLRLPRHRRLLDFLRHQPEIFILQGRQVALAASADCAAIASTKTVSDHVRLMKLHDRASSLTFRTELSKALASTVAIILRTTFVSIHHIVTGGAVGNGTAVEGAANAEVTLFLDDIPQDKRETCVPELLQSLARGLPEHSLKVVSLDDNAVHLAVEGLPSVSVPISAVYETHGAALAAISVQAAETQHSYAVSLAEQRVRFIKKQPEAIKVTARLLKIWRGKQDWSCTKSTPSDMLLELIAVHAASLMPTGKPYDQGEAIKHATSVLANFANSTITWPAPLYGKQTIPETLLSQRPLLMDPVNPFCNVADPTSFDSSEMIALAAKVMPSLL